MKTIIDVLSVRANAESYRKSFTFLNDLGASSSINFNELDAEARRIARGLLQYVNSGDRILLLFPQGLDYIKAFLGCLYANVIAVPLYPPISRKNGERVILVANDCQAKLALATQEIRPLLRDSLANTTIQTLDEFPDNDRVGELSTVEPQSIAFIQYTSGSTGNPKGVVVSHSNIMANLQSLQEATLCGSKDVFCNWLPLFHDLGLINTLLLPIFLGSHSVLMSPARFIKRPAAWLEAISQYRATICGAPNFAFDYCVNRLSPERISHIDLSSWRVAFNAAEPVNANTLRAFSNHFNQLGFRESAFYPSYGMAEATVFISGGVTGESPVVQSFDEDGLQLNRIVPSLGGQGSRQLVACGNVQSGHHLKIVDPVNRYVLPDGDVGEIWFGGPSVARGYWNDMDRTHETFGARIDSDEIEYLRTGDLGFIYHNRLFITGRIKDLIIIKGRNYYPQDIEATVFQSCAGLVKDGGVAFESGENLIVVQEVERRAEKTFDFAKAYKSIQSAIFENFELLVEDIVFIPSRGLNKTSSGKVQRSLTKKQYFANQIESISSLKHFIPERVFSNSVPVSDTEVRLRQFWESELGVDQIGWEDSLFVLGGHSLFATQLVTYIKKHWGADVTIKDIFEHPSIRELANLISSREHSDHGWEIDRRELPARLSHAQQRLWLLMQIEEVTSQYNNHGALRLTGALNISALTQAFTTILQRHQTLRTCFTLGAEGEPVPVIRDASEFTVEVRDITALSEVERQVQEASLLHDAAAYNFDLHLDYMLRAMLILKGDRETVLSVTMHHIASDGWSISILLNEISTLYSAYIQKKENPLAPLEVQYTDYAQLEYALFQGDIVENQLSYWERKLHDLPESHSLPLDYSRPLVQSFRGATVNGGVDKSTVNRLLKICRSENATLFMGLQTAFSVLLSRYSNEADIVMGSPVANRHQSEVVNLIGFFVNILVLRCDLSDNPNFFAQLRKNRAVLLEAYENQQVPFERIVERTQPGRSLSHSPLFQVMLVFQNYKEGILSLPGVEVSPVEVKAKSSKYDLTLNVAESNGGLSLQWEYNTDLFKDSTIDRMARHFEVLLHSLVTAPDESVFKVNMLNAAERQQVLVDWNRSNAAFPVKMRVHELFEQQAERHPHQIAIVHGNEQITYKDLNIQSNRIANYLIARKGVGPGDLVGVCVERSIEMVVSILAILKTGGAYVPLDPAYPEVRLEFMRQDANLATTITKKNLMSVLAIPELQAVCLDDSEVARELTLLSPDMPSITSGLPTSQNLAYVIYTSGSTGQPKGVMVEHCSLVNLVWFDRKLFELSTENRFLNPLSIGFDAGNGYMWDALCSGSTLILADPNDNLFELIEKQSVSHAVMSSALLRMQKGFGGNSLKVLISGGDHCETDILFRLSDSTRYFNVYGPTETTVSSTYKLITRQDQVGIGKPIDNVQVYVLNACLEPVPVGVTGELYIGGIGVARGYLNQPQLTNERFIKYSFGEEISIKGSGRLYRTGDMARWMPDGTLEFRGRNDNQVKIRGFRIELGEIESTLKKHPSVKDALVVSKTSDVGNQKLIAYLITHENSVSAEGFSEPLRQYLGKYLPDYMIPSSFLIIDAFPLTANGKIDHESLPEPDFAKLHADYIAPSSDTEIALCDIWRDVLGVERVGIHDNFFHLGGHSLLVIKVIARLQKSGITVTARQFFSHPSLHDLALSIDESADECASPFHAPPNLIPPDTDQITPGMLPLISLSANEIEYIVSRVAGGVSNIEDIYPLAPMQEGILFHHMMATTGGDPYITPALFRVDGESTVEAFLKALQCVVDRHDVLRTSILWEGLPQPVQVVHRRVALPVTWVDLDADQDARKKMEEMSEPESQKMDLKSPCLIKVYIARSSETQAHFVLLQLHHVISDHVGLEIIQNEVSQLLRNNGDQLTAPTPYREFIAHSLHQASHSDSESFFRDKLGDVEEATFPFGLANVQRDGSGMLEARTSVPDALSRQIRLCCLRMGVAPAAFFHAAWAMVVATCSGRTDVVFGTVVSGRLQGTTGADTMLGSFINTLPLRVNLTGLNATQLVRNLHQSLLELLPYEQTSLTLAQSCSGLPGNTSLFSSLLNYRHSTPLRDAREGLKLTENIELLSAHERSNYPFDMSIDDMGEGFTLDVQVDLSVGAHRIATYMRTALEGLVTELQNDSEKAVSTISVLPEEERQLLQVERNLTHLDYPKDKCIHQLFEEMAEKKPDCTAVVFEGPENQHVRLTYRELNDQSNQLAHYLISEKGVKPDTFVGICMERTPAMIVGILGILKAGGAYVPLDPTYPAIRLDYMVKDSNLTTVITQKHLLTSIPEEQALCLDDSKIQGLLRDQSTGNPVSTRLGLYSNNLAYVIYTSGSTGNPKGVLIEHKGLCNLVTVINKEYKLVDSDNFLQFAPFGFDVSVEEVFGALCNGCGLILRADAWLESATTFWRKCEELNATIVNLPTAFWHELVKDKQAKVPRSVRHISVGGEKISSVVVDDWFKRPDAKAVLCNAYGPTEYSVNASLLQTNPEFSHCIGGPIGNTVFYVLNDAGGVVPVGIPGELCIGGAGLARGYLNNQTLTREKFIDNPFHDESLPNGSERLYKTGDLVRWLPAEDGRPGNLEFLGRIDHQVKIRGFRVELGEIEDVLSKHAQVKDVIVLARASDNGDKRLVAYIVKKNSERVDAELTEILEAYLNRLLPEYMVPGAYVFLERFPLTSNGKVDRNALPDPGYTALQSEYIAPSTATEQLLHEIWRDVLNIGNIGVNDNFFRLGGHSLLVMRVISRLQKAGISVTVQDIFSAPTILGLARLIDDSSAVSVLEFKTPPNLIPPGCEKITPRMLPLVALSPEEIERIVARVPGGATNIEDIYPLAPLQEGILFHHLMVSGGGDPYVTPAVFKIHGESTVEAFLQALQCVVDRHDVLRTSILWDGLSQPVQVVHRRVELPVSRIDLERNCDALAYMEALCAPKVQQMDLSVACLLKLRIARLPESEDFFVLLQLHHMVTDHVGLEVIQWELSRFMAREEDCLPTVIPYREFIAHALYQSRTVDAESYFRQKLGDVEEATTPFDLTDIQGDGSRIIERKAVVPAATARHIRELCLASGVTPASFFHAAWAMVVGMCSGREDVVFGTVMSGRLQGTTGAESILGSFINTLPFRINFSGLNAAELIKRVHQSLFELLPYEQIPLAVAKSCSGLSGDTPLFSALLNYRHSTPMSNETSIFNDDIVFIGGQERTNYPFNLAVDDFGSGFEMDIQVDLSVDIEHVVAYVHMALQGLVVALLDNSEQPVTAIDLLPENERRRLLVEWNATQEDYPRDKCIHELFEEQVGIAPDAIAVVFTDRNSESFQLTYRELNEKSNQLAHYLINERQVKPDSLVGICIERSLDMVVAMLGVLKAGGGYVPLDPSYPAGRLEYMLKDANLATVITLKDLLVTAPIQEHQALCLDDEETRESLKNQPETNLSSKAVIPDTNNLAYVIYSSGSTGTPKGIAIEHKSVTNFLYSMRQAPGLSAQDTLLSVTTISFDIHVLEIYLPLVQGARLVVSPSEYTQQPDELIRCLDEFQVTVMQATPSTFTMLMDHGFRTKQPLKLLCGGEAWPASLKDRLLSQQGIELWNMYGPTETTVWSSVKRVRPEDKKILLGKPIYNTSFYVVDPHGKLLPVGVAGELCVGGDGLARGYFNRPDLTAEKFIRNGFIDNPSARLYRTGDLVRRLNSGDIEFLGRMDHQVKIRGFRIELGEIEQTLKLRAKIKDALVVANEDGEKRLIAYITKTNPDDSDEEIRGDLLSHLHQALPTYMVPAVFVFLDAVPRTPNGKVDRKALPKPGFIRLESEYEAPVTETQKLLCEIWREVLDLDRVGINDNFFRLGGHSLLGVRVVSRLRKSGLDVTVRELFAAPTLSALSGWIDKNVKIGEPDFAVPENRIPPDCNNVTPQAFPLPAMTDREIEDIASRIPGGISNIQDIYPLAPLQEGILFHHMMMENDRDPYIMSALLRVKGKESVNSFLQALQCVVDRHDALRTCVFWNNLPRPVQVVHRQVEVPVTWVKTGNNRSAVEALSISEVRRMDLTASPLLKVHATQCPEANEYFVLLQWHHIVADHAGLEVVQREVALLMEEKGDQLQAPVQYREFVAHTLHQAKTFDGKEFFRQYLGEIEEATLPFNLSDVQGDGSRIVEQRAAIPVDRCRQIRALSQQMGTTPATFFHAAWAMVIGACSGQDDVVFGTVMSGRLQGMAGAEAMLGAFINTLPIRVTLAGCNAAELIQQVHRSLLELLPYEQTPLTVAQSGSGLSADVPLFSSLFNYRRSVQLNSGPEGVSFARNITLVGGKERANYPFDLSVDDLGDEFELDLQIDQSVDIGRIVAYMQTAVERLAAALENDTKQIVTKIDILPEAERRRQLLEWNATQTDYPRGKCIHQLFEEMVDTNPDTLAIVHENGRVTYRELNEQANRLAHYLISEKQVSPDTLVGICMERSVDMIVGIMGILKAGGAYVPLDPRYPEARLEHMIKDARLAIVITHKHLLATTPVTEELAFCLDDWKSLQALAAQSDKNPVARDLKLTSNHLAYVIYTSGSTGNPKGVMIEHKGLSNLACVLKREYEIASNDRILQFAPMSFDMSVEEIFGALCSGCGLVLRTSSWLDSPDSFWRKCEEFGVTVLNLPTAFWHELVADNKALMADSVRHISVGGDKINAAAVQSWFTRTDSKPVLYNAYGPTEYSVNASLVRLTPALGNSIGSAIANTTFYVLNNAGRISPIGVPGELCIGGPGLARGYLNNPALTNEKFISNPFHNPDNPNSSERLYRTGDLVRWEFESTEYPATLEFLGRLDHQVKVRGFRIELGEIEAVLHAHVFVKDVLVLAKQSDSGEKRLVAYIVVEGNDRNESEAIDSLRTHLKQDLPDYMVPTAFVFLEAFPLTPNGKVDRKALPDPVLTNAASTYVAPSTELEKLLCNIWRDLLDMERIGVNDNFFLLGGHSLLATRLTATIGRILDIQLPLKVLFENPTVGDLALYLAQTEKGLNRPTITKVNRDSALVTSYAQQRLWLLDKIDGGNAHYNMPAALRLSGNLNLEALNHAFNTIIERHESLRTCFAEGDEGEPVQIIRPAVVCSIPVVDLLGLSTSEREQEQAKLIFEFTHRSFNLSSDLMFRALVLKTAGQEHILLVNMHHIASDGWSISILINEFCALYRAYCQGAINPLAMLEIQYADYAQWQRNWLQGEVLERQIRYWARQLTDLPEVHGLPLDRPRPKVQTFKGAAVDSEIDKHLLGRLHAVCQAEGATLFMGLHAAFSVLLSRYSNETDIVVGTPIANREQEEIAGLIGFFVNTLVLRSDLSGKPSFISLLRQSKHTLLGAYAHQQVPFEQIVERLQPERSLSHHPLFQVMLILENYNTDILSLPDLEIQPAEHGFAVAKYDLTLNITETQAGLSLAWEYNTDLFEEGTIYRMVTHFNTLLGSLLDAPNENVFQVDMLQEAERHRLIYEWNATQADYPTDKYLHELFEEQVRRTPGAIAVKFEDVSLTYQEVNEQSNRLAHYLVSERAVKPDTLIGVCVERSLDIVVAVLGILKAGGAYVPLDPEYPRDRLRYMIEDAQLATVITQQSLLATVALAQEQILCLDDHKVNVLLKGQPCEDLSPKTLSLKPNHLAYVIYTSGSTGQPKGVMVEHQNVSHLLCGLVERFNITAEDSMGFLASIAFDIAVFELFLPLLAGGNTHIVSRQTLLDFDRLSRALSDCTLLHAVPSLMSEIKDYKLANPHAFSRIRKLFVGGDQVPAKLPRELNQAFSSAQVIELYGPTEATILSTCHVTGRGEPEKDRSIIGRGLANTSLYVFDSRNASGVLLPAGCIGELYIGGAGVARGYLNRPDITQERFVVNPFHDRSCSNSSERLYRTGDLVRWLSDADDGPGTLEFLGRSDHQVKIRGFRIELGEIENALGKHERVKDVLVLAKESGSGDKRLVAYLTQQANQQDSVELITILRVHLQAILPDYMIPNSFVVLEAFPLTPNGKVDRAALPDAPLGMAGREYEAPKGNSEIILAAIWRKLLGAERVGRHDSFFELGGHSLLAIKLIRQLQQHGLQIDVRSIFQASRLHEMAEKLVHDDNAVFQAPANLITDNCNRITPELLPLVTLTQVQIDGIVESVPGGAENIQDIYPLAPLQQGILFHHLLASKEQGDNYILPALLKVTNQLQLDKLIACLNALIARHDVLRTAIFHRALPQAVQVVLRKSALPVTYLELDPSRELISQLQERMAPEELWMDLEQAPLLRAEVTKDSSDNGYFIILANHHIVMDHISQDVLLEEIGRYLSLGAEELAKLPAPAHYREFVAHTLHQANVLDATSFFRKKLGDVQEITVPFDLAEVKGNGNQIAEQKVVLSKKLTRDIREFSQRMDITPATVFHAAWALVVGVCSGRKDVVFGTVMSGRLQGIPGGDMMLGAFINTLPMRVSLNWPNVEQFIQHVHSTLLELLPYEQTSLALAKSCSGLPADAPLFSALLNFRRSAGRQQGGEESTEFSGIEYINGSEWTNYPFSLSVDDYGEEFELTAQVDKTVEVGRVIAYMEKALEELMTALLKNTKQPVAAINILPELENHRQLVEWNATKVSFASEKCIHDLFEEQTEKTPQAIALVLQDEEKTSQTITYEELNRRANQLARCLIAQGVKPDCPVGLYFERTPEMVVAILAVLKAGGAYVPLDPTYPWARLQYVLDDARLRIVLTHGQIDDFTAQGLADRIILNLGSAAVETMLSLQTGNNLSPDEKQRQALNSAHLAYVIYTSGSTGQPKGVQITHRGAVNYLSHAQASYFQNCVGAVVSTALGFDATVTSLLTPLICGRYVQLLPPSDNEIETLAQILFSSDQPLVFKLTPAHLDALQVAGKLSSDIAHCLVVGGDQFTSRLLFKWKQTLLPNAVFVNEYGPTETAVGCSTYVITDASQVNLEETAVPIGLPIQNTQLYVVDDLLNPVPSGVSGELLIGGAGLARGYLNQVELTREKFIANPFRSRDPNSSELLYRTGDLVRWLPDVNGRYGNLEFMGRIDHQVKIRGFRIELGEIENVLGRHALVRDALVLARTNVAGDKHLVAYIAATENDPQERVDIIAVLRGYLHQNLPEYMVPSAFVCMKTFPLTSNGKVDRKALPDPDFSLQQPKYAAPGTDTEKQLCEIWRTLLELERIGINDNFFLLGGHSLLAMKLLAEINYVFNTDLQITSIFESGTICLLAQKIDEVRLIDEMIFGDIDIESFTEEQLDKYLELMSHEGN